MEENPELYKSFDTPTPTKRFGRRMKSVFTKETINHQSPERTILTDVPEVGFEIRQKLIDEGIFSPKRETMINRHFEVPFKKGFEEVMGVSRILSQLSGDIGSIKKEKKGKPVTYINLVSQHLQLKAEERKARAIQERTAQAEEELNEISPEEQSDDVEINQAPISTDFSVDIYFPREGDEDDFRIRWNANAFGKLVNIVLIYSKKSQPEEDLPIPGLNTNDSSDSVARRELILAQVLSPEEAEEQLPQIMEQLENNKYRVGDVKWKWNKGISLLQRTRTSQARINGSNVTLLEGIKTHPAFCKIDATEATQILVDSTTPIKDRITPTQLMSSLRQFQPKLINSNILPATEAGNSDMPRATPLELYDFYEFYEHLSELFPKAIVKNDLAFEVEFNDERMKSFALAVRKWLDQVHSLPLNLTRSADKGTVARSQPVFEHAIAVNTHFPSLT